MAEKSAIIAGKKSANPNKKNSAKTVPAVLLTTVRFLMPRSRIAKAAQQILGDAANAKTAHEETGAILNILTADIDGRGFDELYQSLLRVFCFPDWIYTEEKAKVVAAVWGT